MRFWGASEGAVASLAQAKTEQERAGWKPRAQSATSAAANGPGPINGRRRRGPDARDAAIADARAAARRFSQELAAARTSGETQAAADARAAAELQRDLVAAKAALDVARTPPASPNPRLAQLEAHADAADEARDAALAECVQLRKKLTVVGGGPGRTQRARRRSKARPRTSSGA